MQRGRDVCFHPFELGEGQHRTAGIGRDDTVESAYKSRICPRKKTTCKRKRLVNEFNLFQPSSTKFKLSQAILVGNSYISE